MRPLILISNDDGFRAKGINELIKTVRTLGDVIVMAPSGPRSCASGSITPHMPLHYSLLKEEEGLTIYKCSGTPTDCVKLALSQVLERKPDLMISGINHGTNVAISIQYSGTVGAAGEACVFGIPTIATSLTDYDPDANFEEACRLTKELAKVVLKTGLPRGTYLNLNVPDIPKVKGFRVCKQADSKWDKEYMKAMDPHGNPVFWMTGSLKNFEPECSTSDLLALDEGFASIVPCKLDRTDYNYLEELSKNINGE